MDAIKRIFQRHGWGKGRFSNPLCVVVFGFALLTLPASISAQPLMPVTYPPLVMIAESSNEAINRRVRDLLKDATNGSTAFIRYSADEASKHSDAPVVAVGPAAFTRVREDNRNLAILALFATESFLDQYRELEGGQLSGVLNTPPLGSQAALGKVLLPHATRVAMLARPETAGVYESIQPELDSLGMTGRTFIVNSDEDLIPTLVRALAYGEFILAAPDSAIFNPRTIKHVLLTAYRRNRVLIGPTQAYVRAGALSSIYIPLSAATELAAQFLARYHNEGRFPAPATPTSIGVELNEQVARSLNIPLPEKESVVNAVELKLQDLSRGTQ